MSTKKSFNEKIVFDKLVAGDTFLLEPFFLEIQQTENLLFSKKENIAKLFVSGIINDKKNNFFPPGILQTNLMNKKQKNTSIKSEFTSNNTSKTSEIDTKSGTLSLRVNDINYSKEVNTNSVNSVCVKFMGNIGGNWPTPQVRHSYYLCIQNIHILFVFNTIIFTANFNLYVCNLILTFFYFIFYY